MICVVGSMKFPQKPFQNRILTFSIHVPGRFLGKSLISYLPTYIQDIYSVEGLKFHEFMVSSAKFMNINNS